jgi:hypothetical protein
MEALSTTTTTHYNPTAIHNAIGHQSIIRILDSVHSVQLILNIDMR